MRSIFGEKAGKRSVAFNRSTSLAMPNRLGRLAEKQSHLCSGVSERRHISGHKNAVTNDTKSATAWWSIRDSKIQNAFL